MSLFIGSNAGDVITPDQVSSGVIAIGSKKPGAGADLILAGNGDDIVAGGGGDDLAFLGAGNDRYVWNSGDGSDIIDGGSGVDTLQVNGSSGSENLTLSARSGLAFVDRDIAHTTTTLGSVEHIEFHALAGADNITVKDLSAGGVTDVALDLAATANGTTGDGQADRVTIEGRQSADTITITKDLTGIHIAGTPENVSVTGVDSLDQIVVNGLGGNDTITASNGLGDTFHLTLDGGAGNDTLTGGDGADTLLGGDGNDLVNGGRGNDTALLGTGDDTFVWNPGDGSDIVEGQAGNDTLVFNGSNASETMDLSANGGRARLFRNVGNITMDINDVERVDIAALGGTDVITINDLTGTDVKQVHVDLNSDSAADLVAVNSTAGSDHIRISGSGTETIVSGLAAETHVDHAENIDTIAVHGLAGDDVFDVTPAKSEATLLLDGGAGQDTVTFNGSGANDTINLSALLNGVALSTNGNTISMQLTDVESMQVTGGAGDDTITAGNGLANLTHLTIDGGTGNDTLTGGDGADTLFGGDGNDLVNGGRGNDTALLGTGDDTFVWNPGDGSDIVEGQAGNDTLVFNGSNASETMDLSANGDRARLFRNVGNITMDINDVERVDIAALGGNDVITINDLTGTDVKQVHIDLNADAVADVVAVNATAGNDQVKLTGSGTETIVGGLAAETHVDHAETIDTIAVHTLAGNDTIDVTAAQSSGLLLLDGGEGVDTVTFNGSGANDTVSLLANGNGVTLINGGSSVAMQLTAVEDVVLTGGAGDDTIIAGNGLADAFHLTIDGGVGNDTLTGGDGADTLFGGDGNDLVNGGRGNDTALLGAGDDTFVWNPGDGSDIVEGQAGNDTLVFNGSNASETMDLSANGGRARLFRNVANITMDLNDVERVDIAALGGNDVITVNDLTGTDVKTVHIDLNADSVADVVAVNATAGNDQVHLSNAGTDTIVSGLFAETHVDHAETIDTVAVQTGAGNDTFDVSGMQSNATLLLDGGADTDTVTSSGNGDNDTISLFANGDGVSLTSDGNTVAMKLVGVESVLLAGAAGDDTIAAGNGLADSFHLTLDGGAGNDTLTGGDGADTLFGGDGNDLVNGGRGNDTALLGAGDDTFVWNPGDGSDTVEGQAGHDTLVFNGSNANETMDLSANGDRARLFRNVGNITMDVNGVERVDVSALAGADTLTVNDLTGTDVKEVHVNLTNDAVTDAVVVNATNGNDNVQLTGNAADTVINGLAAQTHVGNAETIDTITVQTGAGDDHIDASAVLGGAKLVLNGGAGDDHITGSAGDDVLIGGAGNDVLIGGGGHDTFVDGEIVFGFDANLDQLDLRSIAAGHDSDWVLAHAHDIEGNVVFDFGDQHVTLMDQSVVSLHSGDFLI